MQYHPFFQLHFLLQLTQVGCVVQHSVLDFCSLNKETVGESHRLSRHWAMVLTLLDNRLFSSDLQCFVKDAWISKIALVTFLHTTVFKDLTNVSLRQLAISLISGFDM